MGRYKKSVRDIIDFDEFSEILSELKHMDIKKPYLKEQIIAIHTLLYYTGKRGVELLDLRKKDFERDIATNDLIVKVKLFKKRKKVGNIEQRQIIPLSIDSCMHLKKFMDYYDKRIQEIDDDDRLFTMTRAQVNHYLNYHLNKQLEKPIWLHLYRATRATKLRRAGASDLDLKEWMGWRDTRPAESYIAMSRETVEKFKDRLD